MPKNKVSDPITGQEITFARLVLTGAMTDRQAAQAAGLNPDSAAYIKSKPHVRAFMLQHCAAVQKELVQQDVEGQRRRNLDREQVLDRLWEIAKMSPEMTRGSVAGQVKALAMIIAMENFIPSRLAASSEKKSAPVPAPAPSAAADPSPGPGPNRSTSAHPSTLSKTPVPYVPLFTAVPDLGVDFPIKKAPLNPFVRPR
jgi:hypothetical protein